MIKEIITTLFIDLDGTIMTNPFWTVVFPTISQALSKATGLLADAITKELVIENQNRLKNPPLNQVLAMDWDDIIQTVAHRYHIRTQISATDLVCQHSAPPYTSILDDASLLLRSLSKDPYRKVVATSMGLSKYQFPVLHSLGLFDIFDDFLMPDLTGYLKTDRQFYNKYLQEANDSIFISIGDNYYDDIFCPKSFGFYAVLKTSISQLKDPSPFERSKYLSQFHDQIRGMSSNSSVLPDAVIIKLAELPNVIYQLEHSQNPAF